MSQKVLLDANVWINAFKLGDGLDSAEIQSSKQLLESILNDDTADIVITPLIRYEVLRGCKSEQEYRQYLEAFEPLLELDIERDVAELSARLFQQDRLTNQSQNINKRNFDVFHFATAKLNQLELKTHDQGFQQLESLYQKLSHE